MSKTYKERKKERKNNSNHRIPFICCTVTNKALSIIFWSSVLLLSLSLFCAGAYYAIELVRKKERKKEGKIDSCCKALYAFPRGADALYHILYDRKLIFSLPHGEQLLFALSLGVFHSFFLCLFVFQLISL